MLNKVLKKNILEKENGAQNRGGKARFFLPLVVRMTDKKQRSTALDAARKICGKTRKARQKSKAFGAG